MDVFTCYESKNERQRKISEQRINNNQGIIISTEK